MLIAFGNGTLCCYGKHSGNQPRGGFRERAKVVKASRKASS